MTAYYGDLFGGKGVAGAEDRQYRIGREAQIGVLEPDRPAAKPLSLELLGEGTKRGRGLVFVRDQGALAVTVAASETSAPAAR